MSMFSDIRARFADEHPTIVEGIDDRVVEVSAKRRDEILDEWAQNLIDFHMEAIRSERNALLAASDWTQTNDAPVDAEAWAAYRQELRDLPAKIKDPTAEVVWPTPPE